MDDDYQHHHEPAVVEEEVKDRGLLDFVGKEEEEKVVEELEKVKIEEGACEEGKKPSLLKKLHRSGSSSSSIPQIHEGDIELGICQDVNSISEVHDSAYDTLNGDNGPAPVDIEALRVGADSGRLVAAMAAGLIAADWSAGIPLTGTDTLMMAKFLHRLFILVSLLAYAFAISLLLKDNVHLHSRSRSKQNLCVQPGAICLATLAVLLMAMTCLLRI